MAGRPTTAHLTASALARDSDCREQEGVREHVVVDRRVNPETHGRQNRLQVHVGVIRQRNQEVVGHDAPDVDTDLKQMQDRLQSNGPQPKMYTSASEAVDHESRVPLCEWSWCDIHAAQSAMSGHTLIWHVTGAENVVPIKVRVPMRSALCARLTARGAGPSTPRWHR